MSSTDALEWSESLIDSQRHALAALPADDPIRVAAVTRVSDAWDELRQALYVVGVDDLEGYAATQLTLDTLARAFAWTWHCTCRPGSIAAAMAVAA